MAYDPIPVARYCTKCGAQMQAIIVPLSRYNKYTGMQESYLKVSCPRVINNKHFHYGHDHFWTAENDLGRLQRRLNPHGLEVVEPHE